MRNYILTGTPGSGKTTLLRHLERLGYGAVAEAATDLIALKQSEGVQEPWRLPSFVDDIVSLQKQRQLHAVSMRVDVQFFDRSPFDTYALAVYLGHPVTSLLREE